MREAVLGKKLHSVPSGHSAYRLLIEADKIRQDPDLSFLVERGGINTWIGLDRRIVCYPCRNLELLNIVAILPDKLMFEDSVEHWNVKGSIDEMMKSFAEFDPVIKRIFTFVSPLSYLMNIDMLRNVVFGNYEIKDPLRDGQKEEPSLLGMRLMQCSHVSPYKYQSDV